MKHSNNWKGGRIKRSGYLYIFKPDHPNAGKQGYVAEHRLIMEKKLKRFLRKEEVVHHINQDVTDNRIKNLELFASHGQHTKLAHPELAEKWRITYKGRHFSPRTEFKKGLIPWSTGKKFPYKPRPRMKNRIIRDSLGRIKKIKEI
jgi:hypothetical protein